MGLELLNNIDVELLRKEVSTVESFPYFYIDNFLKLDFAEQVQITDFPDFSDAISKEQNSTIFRARPNVWAHEYINTPIRKLKKTN